MRFRPKPSRLVKIATVTAASNERPKESCSAEIEVHLIKRPPVLHNTAAATTYNSGENFVELLVAFFTCLFEGAQILPEDTIPWRNNDRNRAQRLRLASQPDQRLGFGSIDVAKLLNLLAFADRHIGKFFSAAENS